MHGRSLQSTKFTFSLLLKFAWNTVQKVNINDTNMFAKRIQFSK